MHNLIGKSKLRRFLFQLAAPVAAATVLSVLAPLRAQASLIVSLSPLSTVHAGSTGNSFDVLLTNTSTSAVSIDGFFFGVTSSSTDITFTDATTSSTTAPYIFDGLSIFGPDIIGPGSTPTDINGSDLGASSFVLKSGAVVALGHVLFDVSPTAPTETVTFDLDAFPGTSLSDELGNNIPIDTLTGGRFQIIGATAPVPEPATLLLVLAVLPLALKWRCVQGNGN